MKTPKVSIARPQSRPFQLRYTCPKEGRQIRVSTGTRDEQEAEQQRLELEAKLLLGIAPQAKPEQICGPQMEWDYFREQYRTLWLDTLRDSSIRDGESRLDIAERILKPRTLGDMVNRNALEKLQADLLAGAASKRRRPRSPHTVKSHLASVYAALNWACEKGWVESVPKIKKIKTGKLRAMKGRPITTEEFERMLDRTEMIVGPLATDSWCRLMRGLWASGLRLEELMHVSWDDPNMIHPYWGPRRLPVLEIPAALQKNDTEEAIPLMPWFEVVLLETPEDKRTGWIFNPISLQSKLGRKSRNGRPNAEWVGKIISRIGAAANVVVHPGDERTGRPVKYASAHDLRRSCADRMLEAEVPENIVTRVMRHASFETTRRHYAAGDVQREARKLQSILGTISDDQSVPTFSGYTSESI